MYMFFIEELLKNFKAEDNKVVIVIVKTKRAQKTRVYSIFQVGGKCFQRCYFSKKEIRLVSELILYDFIHILLKYR